MLVSTLTSPVVPIKTPIINGLSQMPRLDVFAVVEVGDGARDFKDAVVGARRQPQTVHGVFQQGTTRLVELAIFLDEL